MRHALLALSALTLPAFEPVETFSVRVEDGWVKVDVPTG